MKCDIIVPVYNALEEVKQCVKSLIKYTDLQNNRVIIINDMSPDENIRKYLNTLKDKSGFIILENDKNLGFVKTCNKGMKYSSNDIVLLNSDTEVTKNWLQKIKNCAYSDENIATVTPLTNNGTICSVPKFIEDNEIPTNMSMEKYSNLIEKISFKKYPIIPTAVGFCMYIKRNVLNEVGYLDEENFNKGYGEENDFCCRVIEKGYLNVLCDDTFIYHKGSMSFKENKKKYIEDNLKILNRKHPYYLSRVEEFVNKNPLKDIQENIRFYIEIMNNKRKNILYILHNGITRPINHPIGGTEFHVLDLVRGLKSFNKYVLIPSKYKLILQIFAGHYTREIEFDLENNINIENFEMKEYREILENIILGFNIDLIHVHHYIKNTSDVAYIAKELGIPLIATLHDYYCITPTITLLDENNQYKGYTKENVDFNKVIKEKYGFDKGFLDIWNNKMLNTLKLSEEIIVPSNSAKEIIENYYKELKGKIRVIEHGVKEKILNKSIQLDRKEFNIAFIGGLAPYKGSGLIYKLIANNKNKNIKWHIFGNLGDQKLSLMNRDDVIKHGRYERDEIQNLLIQHNINLVGILSQWPETYSYTLTEAWMARIPVFATDIGALGERIKKAKAGITFELNTDPKDILKKIDELIKDNYLYNNLLQKVNSMRVKSISEMLEEYCLIYNSVINENEISNKYDSEIIYQAYLCSKLDKNYLNIEQLKKMQQRVGELENEITIIKNTLGWKILDKFRKKCPSLISVMKKIVYLIATKNKKEL